MPITTVVKEGEIIHVSFRVNSWPYPITFNIWADDRIEMAETLVEISAKLRRHKDKVEPKAVSYGDA